MAATVNQEEVGTKEEEGGTKEDISKEDTAVVVVDTDTEVSPPSPPVAFSADESIHAALTPFITNSNWNLLSLPCP